jgi:hypothetical protein
MVLPRILTSIMGVFLSVAAASDSPKHGVSETIDGPFANFRLLPRHLSGSPEPGCGAG